MSNSSSSSSSSGEAVWYPEDCVFQVQLDAWSSPYDAGGRAQAFRLRAEITDSRGLDPNLFVFQVGVDPHSQEQSAYFSRVASPNDLEELYVGIPEQGSDISEFRLAEVDLVFRSPTDRDNALTAIRSELDELCLTLTSLCRSLGDPQTFVISGEGAATLPENVGGAAITTMQMEIPRGKRYVIAPDGTTSLEDAP